MNLPSTLRRNNRARHGTALVEMAIVMLLLLIMTMGLLEFGWMSLKQQQISNCARQAARIAARTDATNTQVTTRITQLMTAYGLSGSGYTTTFSPSNVASVTKGATVSVQVSVPYNNIRITGAFLPTYRNNILPANIRATVVMEKEGP